MRDKPLVVGIGGTTRIGSTSQKALELSLRAAEDLGGDARVYFDGCAAGLISRGADWQGCGNTLGALRAVAHSLRAWPTPMGAMVNTSTRIFDEQGNCLDQPTKAQLELVGAQVVQFALQHRKTTQ